MHTTDPAAAGLFAAILAEPADDTPRLVLADWLDEHGEPERAEFIRAQVHIAAITAELQSDEDCGGVACSLCPEREDLRQRERELLQQHHGQLVPYIIDGQSYDVCSWGVRFSGGTEYHFRRGFVAEITLPIAAWAGERCKCTVLTQGEAAYVRCPYCHGSGWVGRHGPQLVRAAPIEVVRLTDVLAMQSVTGLWVFQNLTEGALPACFAAVTDRVYQSKEDAEREMSGQLLRWAYLAALLQDVRAEIATFGANWRADTNLSGLDRREKELAAQVE